MVVRATDTTRLSASRTIANARGAGQPQAPRPHNALQGLRRLPLADVLAAAVALSGGGFAVGPVTARAWAPPPLFRRRVSLVPVHDGHGRGG